MTRFDGTRKSMLFVTLGMGVREHDDLWRKSDFIRDVVRLRNAAPSGRRAGSRALGLGVDSALVALKVLLSGQRGPYLAVNPWVGAALRLTGKRNVSVTGIYAQEGSRSYRILRAVLGDSPVITTVELESSAWRKSGGNARSVLYGNTFNYPRHAPASDSTLRIFVGGSSDRDPAAVLALEREVKEATAPVQLVVVADEKISSWSGESSTISHTGRLSPQEFGEQLAAADVVFLPLRIGNRAAGHMVTVGALESGIPVASSSTSGMFGYVDGLYVREIKADEPLLPQLGVVAKFGTARTEEIVAYWRSNFSLPAYIRRIGEAIEALI